ncbi:MAG: hypothetical protein R3288_10690 [Woeseiaceae bacterium]|nr:hypothetical protein [Woeseiaceae bacterium]
MPDTATTPQRILLGYYGATFVFLLLDVLAGLNVRIAFFEGEGALRAAYYAVCFTCLGLMLWQPAWTVVVAAFESIVTLSALIINFGTRVIGISDAVLDGSEPYVTMPEVANFLLAGSMAWVAWLRGMRDLKQHLS